MSFFKNRILVLAPHTDDAELGCGGTIARLLEEGAQVRVAAFSTAEDSLPPGAPVTQLRDEFVESMETFGISPSQMHIYNFPVRKLSYHRQEVLEELIALRASFRPDIVFGPASSDLHQDHQVLHAESLRAFKEISFFGYELPWNHISFSSNAFLALEKRHVVAKWRALSVYKSQITLNRLYFKPDFVESLARIRGVQVKAEFAEAFEVLRLRL